MRSTQYIGGPGPSVVASTPPGELDVVQSWVGAQNTPDGLAAFVDALASTLANLREQVARLETDVRHLQSQTANRA